MLEKAGAIYNQCSKMIDLSEKSRFAEKTKHQVVLCFTEEERPLQQAIVLLLIRFNIIDDVPLYTEGLLPIMGDTKKTFQGLWLESDSPTNTFANLEIS